MVFARLNYVELPATDVAGSKTFFEAAFGWDLTPFGPHYAATIGAGTDIGLNGHARGKTPSINEHGRPSLPCCASAGALAAAACVDGAR